MLAFRLRLVLAALALASFAAAWWAAGRIGLGSAGLLVLALALCFAVPALLVLFSFVAAFAYRSVPRSAGLTHSEPAAATVPPTVPPRSPAQASNPVGSPELAPAAKR